MTGDVQGVRDESASACPAFHPIALCLRTLARNHPVFCTGPPAHLGKLLHAGQLARHRGVCVAQVHSVQHPQQAAALLHIKLGQRGVRQAGPDAQHLGCGWDEEGEAGSARQAGGNQPQPPPLRPCCSEHRCSSAALPCCYRLHVLALPSHLVDEGSELRLLQQRLDGGRQLSGGGGGAHGQQGHKQGCKRGAHGC